MKLLVNRTRCAALSLALGAAALLASCGGGDPVVRFQPTRVLAFGDEYSVITSAGRKYTVNALLTDANGVKTINCDGNALWIQRLAADFGLVFPQCNPAGVVNPRSRIYAEAGDDVRKIKVADLAAQITLHLQTDSFSATDLVTLFAGQNDVLEQYARYPGVASDVLLATARERGLALAAQVSLVADRGGKVLVTTVPDLAYSPFALAENARTGDGTRGALLGELVAKFNEGLRLGLAKETGAEVALMKADELVQGMAKFPTNYGGMTNVIAPVCDKALAVTVDLCTTDTLVTGGDANRYLWADDTHLSPNGHIYLGSLAITQARKNPF
jgi:phospholipase/lecithinase/hemolysin